MNPKMNTKVQDLDPAYFRVEPKQLGSETVFLVNPKEIDVPWTQDNLIFRSSVWSEDGAPVSLSFKKFFNWGEKPDLIPLPDPSEHCEFYTKIDGTLLAVSKWKGQLIVRTRGTVDASAQPNGSEIPLLMKKYPKAFEFEEETSTATRIFEWTTPTNKIILDYGKEPLLWLIGIITHSDYSYASQTVLNFMAAMLEVLRPERHQFNTLSEMLKEVQTFEDKEGVCVYSGNGQIIHKVKSLKYLMMHRFKEHATPKAVLELFLEQGCPSYQAFREFFIKKFDFECFTWVETVAKEICLSYEELLPQLMEVSDWVQTIKHLTKKETHQASKKYKDSSLMPGAFLCLNNKNLHDVKYIKKMMQEKFKTEEM